MSLENIEVETVRVLPDGRVNPRNAGVFLDRSTRTLANWRSQGRGPRWKKVGGRVFYDLDGLRKFVDGDGEDESPEL